MIPSTTRTLLLSTRNYEQDVWRCGPVEFENVVCSVDDVDLIAPQARQRTPGFVLRQCERVTRRAFAIEFSHVPRLERVRLSRDYELLFFYAQGLGDLAVLDAVPDWRKRCVKAVCFVEESWAHGLAQWSGRTFDQLAKFDLIVCSQHGSVGPLARRAGQRCEWLPAGIDTLRFHPGFRPPPRTIDVFAMGRRSEVSHRVLLEHATRHGWTYLFDTLEVRRVRGGDHMQHRRQLAELVKRSRYFLANRGRIDRVEDTGEQEEVGLRSLEGAAGGAVLIGDAPRGAHVAAMFGWPDAHIHVPFDSTDIAEVISALDREPERLARIRRENVVQSLRRHDWAHRWQTVLGMLGLAPTERLRLRMQELEQLAVRTAHVSHESSHGLSSSTSKSTH